MDRTPLPIPQVDPSLNAFDQIEPQFSGEQAADAAWELALPETGMGMVARSLVASDLESTGGAPISAEEANARYPDMQNPFREAVSPFMAQHLYNQEFEKRRLEERIQKGPQDFYNKAKQFGIGMLAHVMDPLEFGVGAVAGWGVGGLVARGSFGTTAAIRQSVVGLRTTPLSARLTAEGIEAGLGNLIENVASEGALMGLQEGVEQSEYDMGAGALNIAAGTILGTGLGIGIKEVARGIDVSRAAQNRALKTLKSTSPEADRALFTTSVAAVDADKVPNSGRLIEALAKETDVHPAMRSVEYNYVPLEPGTPKKFYAVTGIEPRDLGDGFGLGRQFTDNPSVANAAAARSMSDAKGKVGEFEVSELNPLNLDQKFDAIPDVRGVFDFALSGSDTAAIPDDFTVKEAMDFISSFEGDELASVLGKIKTGLQELGFDSTVHDGSKRLGVDHSPHNVVEVFDDTRARQLGERDADPKEIRVPTDEEQKLALQESTGLETRTDMDLRRAREVVEEVESEDLKIDVEMDADRETQLLLEEYDQLDKMGQLDPLLKKDLEAIREMDAGIESMEILAKAAKVCVVG